MAPLIYVAASVPLFIGSAAFLVLNLVFGLENGSPRASVIYTVGMFAIIAMLLTSIFVRAIRGTYGDTVGQVLVSSSALMITITSTLWNPWNWFFVAVWLLLLSVDVFRLRRVQVSLGLTQEQAWSPDSLSKRFLP